MDSFKTSVESTQHTSLNILTWKTTLDFSRRYLDKEVPTTTPLSTKMRHSWQIKQLQQIPLVGATQGRHCSSENIIRLTHWRMWMWRYLPKRLELLLRIVLAFPKLSRMGKTSIGWSRRRKKWNQMPPCCFVPNWSNCTSAKVFPCAFHTELPVAGCRFCPDTWSWGSGLSAW